MAESEFDVENIVARVNDKENTEAFNNLGVETVISPRAVADAIERKTISDEDESVGSPGSNLDSIEHVVEESAGKTLAEFEETLDDGIVVSKIFRKGERLDLKPDLELKERDLAELIGREESLDDSE